MGVDLIFINISRVAHAQRAASLPTNLRGPHVETDRGSEKRNERKEERETRDRGGETRGRMAKGARSCVYARTLLMNVCIEYRWW